MVDLTTSIGKLKLKNPVIAVCPCCGNIIHAQDLDFNEIIKTDISQFPFEIEYICGKNTNKTKPNKNSSHVLILYLDRYFDVRGVYLTDYSR